jgi:tetratricopeptide (TPR) repeat protein
MRLSNVRKFLVRPTSSVLPFMDRPTDAFTCARELGVEFLVDGIIRRVGDSIRVTAQLLDVSENATRWSGTFSETIKDVLELEDTISEQVTRSILPKLSGEDEIRIAKRGTDNPEAHDAYLQGRYFWNQFTPDSFVKSLNAFSRAVELDPNYALAYAGISDYYTWAGIYGLLSPRESHPKVLEAAEKALSLDEDLAEAHGALGLYYSNQQRWADAEQSYRRSIELNPGYPLSHEWLSAVLVGTGRFDEGIKELTLAEDLNPMTLRPIVLTAWTTYQTRRYAQALAKARELERMNPDFMQSNLQIANILLELDETEQALRYASRAVELEPDALLPFYVYCFALARSGETEKAEEQIAKWEAAAQTSYVTPYFLGMAHIAIGSIDKAFDYFEAARLERSAWTIWFGTEPKLDPVRNDERYLRLLRATNNPIIDRFGPDNRVPV